MWDHDVGVIPVIDADGVLIGIVTDRDICMAAYTTGRPLHAISVSDTMATNVQACHEGDTLESAGRTMSKSQVRRLPVIDEVGKPIGVLSLNDLALNAATSRSNGAATHVAQTLAEIGKPRTNSVRAARQRP
jgi:CBS domain-containing protein